MSQVDFLNDTDGIPEKPVNVSSVPKLSPFRYPGGKTWFVPRFREWMRSLPKKPSVLVEPFAGGGIISLTAVRENLVSSVVMVEKDPEVAAVWITIIEGNADWLANRILNFEMSAEAVTKELLQEPTSIRDKAFQTILKNRTYHGGILAGGSGLLKHGENGKGVHSRWYPTTIANRIKQIGFMSHKITFIEGDAFEVMKEYSKRTTATYFIDPPYSAGGKKAGSRLYKHWQLDHEKLFSMCQKLKGEFLLTYDVADEVKNLSEKYGFQFRGIPMTNKHHAEMDELLISKNLNWM